MRRIRRERIGKQMTPKKKLIEVALPLAAINVASAREKSIRHGHPSTLHLWWARRPLAAARAIIFAQMVDDPSSHPEQFPTEELQEKERQRLFKLIEQLVLWESTSNERVLEEARQEIWKSWRTTCAENQNHPRAKELFDPERLPAFHDPFAGGGALPLEAQRLGLESYASDLNPVAVLINKAMIEIPSKFAGCPPVNPASHKDGGLIERQWNGAQGLAEDVRYYGQWMRDEADKRIGHLYPKIEVTAEMVMERPELRPYSGKWLTVIAWIWARTVKSPNPAFAQVNVPLASTFMLSTKADKEAYIEPVIEGDGYRFQVKLGKPRNAEAAKNGTKLARGANFRCLMSGTPIGGDYIKAEGQAGRMDARLMAIVVEGERERVYLAPSLEQERVARAAMPEWVPEGSFVEDARAFTPCIYGLREWQHLFTARQMVALTTFSDLVQEARIRVKCDALNTGLLDDDKGLGAGGTKATAYADGVATYLALCVSKSSDYWSNICIWRSDPKNLGVGHVFARQAIQMTWDYAEGNPFSGSSGSWLVTLDWVERVTVLLGFQKFLGQASQSDAAGGNLSDGKVVSTDPPYYDNVPYADLSDFFYIWLRRSLKPVFPDLFSTLAVPKAEELTAFAYRHDGKDGAEAFFLKGMTQAMHRLAEQAHPAFPITIYYAFRQSETDSEEGTSSTGWETFLDAVIHAGLTTTGTWPVRTELGNRTRGMGSNALASSIVLVCRPRATDAHNATRREFIAALKAELPEALAHLQRGNIAPVDLAQAAIGPGMAVYTRYGRVLDAGGKALSVRDALALINQTLDEVLAEQEGDFDADSRWALAWFEDHGFEEGLFGDAHTYFVRFNTAENALKSDGIIESGRSKVRLFKPNELPANWDPLTDLHLTAWKVVHQLIRVLEEGGESAAAALVSKLGSKAELARELAYRLYTMCERKKRAAEALSYNALVQSWPEISRLARDGTPMAQTQLFDEG